MQPTYDLSWILPYVRQSMHGVGNMNFDRYFDNLCRILESVGVPSIQKSQQSHTGHIYNFDAAHLDIRNAATEAFFYLEQNRFILRPAPTQQGAFLPHGQFQVTQRGLEWVKGAEPLPEDYNGYMKQFDSSVDVIVKQYVSEALNTYIRGTYFASAVMIGAAAEASIYDLADSLIPALQNVTKQATLKKLIGQRGFEKLFEFIESVVVTGHKNGALPYSVMEGTTRHLLSLFEYIRVQRNDAVHPRNFQVSADSVRFTVSAFPLAFRKVESLRRWCDTNPGAL
jgi:hypothetical protein